MFAFVGVIAGLFSYYGDKRLEAHDLFLGDTMFVVAIVLACAAFGVYVYLMLNAPNSVQAREFDRSSAQEIQEHINRVESRKVQG